MEGTGGKKPRLKWWMLKTRVKRNGSLRGIAGRLLSVKSHGPMEQIKDHLIRAHACLNNMHLSGSITHYKLARKELIDMRDTLDRILTVDMPRDPYEVRMTRQQRQRIEKYMKANPDKFPDVNNGVHTEGEAGGQG